MRVFVFYAAGGEGEGGNGVREQGHRLAGNKVDLGGPVLSRAVKIQRETWVLASSYDSSCMNQLA